MCVFLSLLHLLSEKYRCIFQSGLTFLLERQLKNIEKINRILHILLLTYGEHF